MDEPRGHYAVKKKVTEDICYMVPVLQGIKIVKAVETESTMIVARDWGSGTWELFNGYRASVSQDERSGQRLFGQHHECT